MSLLPRFESAINSSLLTRARSPDCRAQPTSHHQPVDLPPVVYHPSLARGFCLRASWHRSCDFVATNPGTVHCGKRWLTSLRTSRLLRLVIRQGDPNPPRTGPFRSSRLHGDTAWGYCKGILQGDTAWGYPTSYPEIRYCVCFRATSVLLAQIVTRDGVLPEDVGRSRRRRPRRHPLIVGQNSPKQFYSEMIIKIIKSRG